MTYKNVIRQYIILCLFRRGNFDRLFGKLYSRQNEAISKVGKRMIVC